MPIDRLRAAELGRATIQILREGHYVAPSGHIVDPHEAITRATAHTQTYPPEQDGLLADASRRYAATQITVTNESSLTVAHRLVAAGQQPVALNFASATHPGGGWVRRRAVATACAWMSSALVGTQWPKRRPRATMATEPRTRTAHARIRDTSTSGQQHPQPRTYVVRRR